MTDEEWEKIRRRALTVAFKTGRPVSADTDGVLRYTDGAKEGLDNEGEDPSVPCATDQSSVDRRTVAGVRRNLDDGAGRAADDLARKHVVSDPDRAPRAVDQAKRRSSRMFVMSIVGAVAFVLSLVGVIVCAIWAIWNPWEIVAAGTFAVSAVLWLRIHRIHRDHRDHRDHRED